MIDYTFSIGNLLTIGVFVVTFAGGYATVKQQMNETKDKMKLHDTRLDSIESSHRDGMASLWTELRAISATLNQIVGRLDSQIR